MAAELFPATQGSPSHRLRLPPLENSVGALEEVRYGLASWAEMHGSLTLESGAWALHTGELRELITILESRGLRLVAVEGRCPSTLVAAAALGLPTTWPPDAPAEAPAPDPGQVRPGLLVHRGTLRSGDHLQAEGSVLLLGDLNPGARISAGGHVLVWGRLRGVAHAGRRGDTSARIVALQLRPLQLRIAGAVARGPEERPPEGLAEEARLEDGEIRIEPADPVWPLGE
jgi:septum site-determining protein MinC